MIFVDTNLFVRAIISSDGPGVTIHEQVARDFFRRADLGELELISSGAVIAEVAYVLTAKRQYAMPVTEAVSRLIPLVRSRGLTLDRPSVVHDALLIWREFPALGFVDALGAAYGKQPRTELATFDRDLDRVPGGEPARPQRGLTASARLRTYSPKRRTSASANPGNTVLVNVS